MSTHPFLSGPTHQVTLTPARYSLDLGDGSERGEYVNQDHIFRVLGRPHRSINLMYCYYPLDKGWPLRASRAFPHLKPKKGVLWVHPYDDYFPYGQAKQKGAPRQPFDEIRDVRRHGQDATLTLAMDTRTPETHLTRIARELKPFGRIRVRINHECDGHWFTFSRRSTKREITDFFIRFAQILKKEAPHCRVMCCWGHWDRKKGVVNHLEELGPMLRHADVWSLDKYLTLHFGWPSLECEEGEPGYSAEGLDACWEGVKQTQKVFAEYTGMDKPVEIGEFNADGDVGGSAVQTALVKGFYDRVVRQKPNWLSGITFYQFRDRGGLGLETEDPNHPEVGIPTPLLNVYRKITAHPSFQPREWWKRSNHRTLRWTASDNAQGLGWITRLKGKPVFFDLYLPKQMNLLVRVGKGWFYKKPGVEKIDVLSGVSTLGGGRTEVAVFAPPTSGENPRGAESVFARLAETPRARVRYAWKKRKF